MGPEAPGRLNEVQVAVFTRPWREVAPRVADSLRNFWQCSQEPISVQCDLSSLGTERHPPALERSGQTT